MHNISHLLKEFTASRSSVIPSEPFNLNCAQNTQIHTHIHTHTHTHTQYRFPELSPWNAKNNKQKINQKQQPYSIMY